MCVAQGRLNCRAIVEIVPIGIVLHLASISPLVRPFHFAAGNLDLFSILHNAQRIYRTPLHLIAIVMLASISPLIRPFHFAAGNLDLFSLSHNTQSIY